jgi:hypothetical protein
VSRIPLPVLLSFDMSMKKEDSLGWIVVGGAAVGIAAGLAGFALYEGLGVISVDTAVDLSLLSLCASAGAVIVGFALRRRVRFAHQGMFLGLATLGGWFLLFVYALGQDTP